jgi:gliding motility-associated-like protein
MKKFLLLLLLVTSYTGWGQCDVYITPGSIQVIDHNPGISFAFEIQNDDIIPYSGGPLYMDWALSGFISGPIWEFDLNPIPILPGQSRFVSTPVFDIPLPGNVPGNWTPYAGWTGSEYTSFKLALVPIYSTNCYEWITNEDGSLWTDFLSDGCDNPDGDNFCNDVCEVELVDFNLETEELTIIPYSTYCPNITNPAWFNQYPYNDPYIFGFTLTFTTDEGSINVNIGGQEIYASDTPLTIDLSNGILSIILEPLLESINNGEFCDLTLTLYNLNNTGQNINDVLPHQVIELVNLCPNEVIDASLDTLLYDVGCNGLEAYWTPEIYITNNGDIPITEYCIKFQVLGQSNDTICFDTGNIIEPGETFIQTWPNVYDWGTLSLHLLDVNGESEQSWNNFGLDINIGNNMYVQVINNEPDCIIDIYGCTDETANNFNPEANSDDGSCLYDVLGCIDSSALNFNPLANIDDGSCEYNIFGCTNSFASNYNPLATVEDGSCILYLAGCTDFQAINYNPSATLEDGSCVYNSCDGLYFAPNTFSPNNDGINDGWSIVTDSECWIEFQVLIFDRWGRLVWESNIIGEVWEGSNSNGSHYVADGIYVYTVKGVGYNPSHTFQTSGYITIFR